ncbi:MAG: 2-amino-4-hydroxy-6-hydroxymethyldihydropteridine diphosphokinase [Verrucomicrobiales bacterium]|nr:2-amino-4-hydroxy-6-hydroxymethyldihydropteridine diphosphokinase [Verrucomicrobiales bacterium]
MSTAGLSLGSNLGDRIENLRAAVRLLEPLYLAGSLRFASLYETEPVDCPPDSPSFLNTVVEFKTELPPLSLLQETQAIESFLGRAEKRKVNAPRPVDLDLLYYDTIELSSETLTLPHPRMKDRAFVLRPLAELRPEYANAAAQLDQRGIFRLSESLL